MCVCVVYQQMAIKLGRTEGQVESIKQLYDEKVSQLIKCETELRQLKEVVKTHFDQMLRYRQTKTNCPQIVKDFVQWGLSVFGETAEALEGGAVAVTEAEAEAEAEAEVSCVICQEEIEDDCVLWECDVCHKDEMHFLCLRNWVEKSRAEGRETKCPLCNAEIYEMEGLFRSMERPNEEEKVET